jgi:hypothetical protein
MVDEKGNKSEFCLEIRSRDALPTAICTVSQYENDVRGTEVTSTIKVVRTMHGFLVANGKALTTSAVKCRMTEGHMCCRDWWQRGSPHPPLTPPAGLTYGAFFNGEAWVFVKIDRTAPSADGTSFPMYMSEPIFVSGVASAPVPITCSWRD